MNTRSNASENSVHVSSPPLVSHLLVSTGLLFALTLVTGIAYPLAVTGIARLAFRESSGGSMLVSEGKVRGSRALAQPFEDPKYFWGRLSATATAPNNAQASAGSNFGPSNPELTKAAKARIAALLAADPDNTEPAPVDLVTSSASGLDPHITPAAALYQVGRVARARGIEPQRVQKLVEGATSGRDLGLLGEPRVNVLVLNLSLDSVLSR